MSPSPDSHAAPASPAPSRLRAGLIVGLACGIATALALVAAKVICIGSVWSAPNGRAQIDAELSLGGALAWFLPDVLGGLAGGALLGCIFGLLAGPRRGKVNTLVRSLLAAIQLLLAFLSTVAAWVYILFGAQPTWQWLKALGGGGGGGDATDSVLNLLFSLNPMLTIVSQAVLMVGGTLLISRVLYWRRGRWVALGALALLLLLPLTGAALLRPPPSPLDLDRNGLVEFARTALGFTEDLGPVASKGTYGGALRSVNRRQRASAPLGGYRKIQAAAGDRRLNVLIGILETTAVKHMQVTGGKLPNTPTMAALARRGILWPWHYAHMPSSMPAIYSILSGNYPGPNARSVTDTRPRIDCRSLSEILHERGYRTSLWHSGRFSFYKKDRFLSSRGFEQLHDATTMPGRERYKEGSWGLEEAASIDAMLDWIGGKGRKPFFAVWVPVYPHHPYKVPDKKYKKFGGRGRLGNYRNAIYYVDTVINRLIQGLRSRGVERDTLLVLVGDHGEGFGEHAGSKMHGSKIYDEAVRTLVIWSAPGALERGYVDQRRFGHVAITPTILDLLRIPRQPQHAGISALAKQIRPMVPLSTSHVVPLFGFVDGRWKFIHDRKKKTSLLYDLSRDPDETRSLTKRRPGLVSSYIARIEPYVAAHNAWEQRLPNLAPSRAAPLRSDEGEAKRWVVDPKTCRYDQGYFEVVGARLRATHKGRNTITCTHRLPARRGVFERLTLRGTERIGGAWIEASVQQVLPDGRRRGIAYCLLNQGKQCIGEPAQGRAEIMPGGHLELDIRYVMFYRVPKNVDRYHASLAEVRYRLGPKEGQAE